MCLQPSLALTVQSNHMWSRKLRFELTLKRQYCLKAKMILHIDGPPVNAPQKELTTKLVQARVDAIRCCH